jgi:hypothetical protein
MKLKDLAVATRSARDQDERVVWFRNHGVFRKDYIEKNEKGELFITGNHNEVTLTNIDELPYPFHLQYRTLQIEDSSFISLDEKNLPPETEYLHFKRCDKMVKLMNISHLERLSHLQFEKCAIEELSKFPAGVDSLYIDDTNLKSFSGIGINSIDRITLHRNNALSSLENSGIQETRTIEICGSKSLDSLAGLPKVNVRLTIASLPKLSFAGIHKQLASVKAITFGKFGSRKWDYTGPLLGLLQVKDLMTLTFSETEFSNKDFFNALTIINKHLKTKNIAEAMDELMEVGLKEYAKL